jgi:hypothetical protein
VSRISAQLPQYLRHQSVNGPPHSIEQLSPVDIAGGLDFFPGFHGVNSGNGVRAEPIGLKARNVIARAGATRRPGNRDAINLPRPVGAAQIRSARRDSISIPRISFIQWFPVLLAKPAKLGLKIPLLVMLRLVANVFPHGLDMHRVTLNSP